MSGYFTFRSIIYIYVSHNFSIQWHYRIFCKTWLFLNWRIYFFLHIFVDYRQLGRFSWVFYVVIIIINDKVLYHENQINHFYHFYPYPNLSSTPLWFRLFQVSSFSDQGLCLNKHENKNHQCIQILNYFGVRE